MVLAEWARSHFLRVCWKRSTLPVVVGWFGAGVFLFDVEVDEECFELVAAAAASGKAGGVNHAVVGQDRSGKAVLFCGFGECFDNDEAPDTLLGGAVEAVARVVVEPGDDFGVGAGG